MQKFLVDYFFAITLSLALSQRNSPQETSALIKASSGAIEKLQIIELSNMSREIKKLQKSNFSIYGLAGEGENDVYELENETGNVALILGQVLEQHYQFHFQVHKHHFRLHQQVHKY